jgi:histidinol-phosphate aminotransferase
MYYIYSTIAGAKVIEVESKQGFNMDIDGIIKAANESKAKLIFLCNPNNPTGNIIPRRDIVRTLEATDAIVVVDEAYYEFYGQSVMDLVGEYPQLIVLRTMSKAFALAGARIGYTGASKQVMELLMRVKPPYNLNSFSQTAACVYLENLDKIKENIESIVKGRKKISEGLEGLKGIRVYPSEANFVLIESPYSGEILKECEKAGIILRSYSEPALKNCIRITSGQESENKSVLEVIKRTVERYE